MPITASDLEDEYQEEQAKKTKAKADADHLLRESSSVTRTCRWVLLGGLLFAMLCFLQPSFGKLPEANSLATEKVSEMAVDVPGTNSLLTETVSETAAHEELCPGGAIALTYASHGGRDDRFCRTLESAVRNHIDLRVLGWGIPWEGLSQKLTASHTALANLPADCIVLFTDSYDVLFTGEMDAIVQAFQALRKPLVLSAECGCWPQVLIDNGVTCRDKYPPSPTLYRYLNSGSWIGRAHAAAAFIHEIIQHAEAAGNHGKDFNKINDQELASDLFMRKGGATLNMTLDYYATLFQPMHKVHDTTAVPNCDPYADLERRNGVFFNRRTNSIPKVFHFNGGGKKHHLSMEGAMWWKTDSQARSKIELQRVRETKLKFHNTWRPLEEICPEYFQSEEQRPGQ